MRSLEADYFFRLARVGAVVLAMFVLGFLVLRAQQRARPPTPVAVDTRVPVILLENARIVEEEPAILSADEYLSSSKSIVPAGLFGSHAGQEKVTFDLGDADPAALRIAPLQVDMQTTTGGALLEPPTTYFSSSKSAVLLETPPPPETKRKNQR